VSHHIGDTNEMSDTPRTDEAQFGTGRVSVSFARQLERELNESNQRIKRLEEQLMDSKNKHAVLVADVVLNEDRAERIKRLEEENDAMRADLLLWQEQEVKP
jgi:septal ring factor EnvC (AmiA/AmiB activator)